MNLRIFNFLYLVKCLKIDFSENILKFNVDIIIEKLLSL